MRGAEDEKIAEIAEHLRELHAEVQARGDLLVTDKRVLRVHGVFTTTIDAVHLNQITDTSV